MDGNADKQHRLRQQLAAREAARDVSGILPDRTAGPEDKTDAARGINAAGELDEPWHYLRLNRERRRDELDGVATDPETLREFSWLHSLSTTPRFHQTVKTIGDMRLRESLERSPEVVADHQRAVESLGADFERTLIYVMGLS